MLSLFTIPSLCVTVLKRISIINNQNEFSGIPDKNTKKFNKHKRVKGVKTPPLQWYKLLVIKGPGVKDVPLQRCMQKPCIGSVDRSLHFCRFKV